MFEKRQRRQAKASKRINMADYAIPPKKVDPYKDLHPSNITALPRGYKFTVKRPLPFQMKRPIMT